MKISIGCMNLAWHQYPLEQALSGISAGGYTRLALCYHQGIHLIRHDTPATELTRIKQLLEENHLTLDMVITDPDYSLPQEEWSLHLHTIASRISSLGGKYLITCGVQDESHYEQYFQILNRACKIVAIHGLTILLKPHGGISASSDEMLKVVERVEHPNFGICYDPGNILYYTAKRPEKDLPRIVQHVRAICLKDECGGIHGDVMITLGTGDVNFEKIFSILADAGFEGPAWVEGIGGSTVEEVNAEARKTLEFLADILSRYRV